MAIEELFTQRIAVVKDLHDLGDRVDQVAAALAKSIEGTNRGAVHPVAGDDKEDNDVEHEVHHYGHAKLTNSTV
jgi:hypothetical protein